MITVFELWTKPETNWLSGKTMPGMLMRTYEKECEREQDAIHFAEELSNLGYQILYYTKDTIKVTDH